jgi:hypothetical protein
MPAMKQNAVFTGFCGAWDRGSGWRPFGKSMRSFDSAQDDRLFRALRGAVRASGFSAHLALVRTMR